MSFEENSEGAVSMKDRVVAQMALFKRNILSRIGLTGQQTQEYDNFQEIDPKIDPEARQLQIKDRILNSLAKKGLLATKEENNQFYKNRFGLNPGFTPPEVYLEYPGGGTFVDPASSEVKIYLNPLLAQFKPDYQLLAVLEEAIHYYQLKHSGRTVVNNQDEIEAKDKILKIADFLGLSEERRKLEEDAKNNYSLNPKDINLQED